MENLTLEQTFGKNAIQNAEFLIIQKASLPKLSPAINNTAESLLIALILQAWNEFQGELIDEMEEIIVDEYGNAISYDQRGMYESLHVWFWRRQFIGKILDIFVIDVFISPPTSYGTSLSANLLR